jgi:hypothetical protein
MSFEIKYTGVSDPDTPEKYHEGSDVFKASVLIDLYNKGGESRKAAYRRMWSTREEEFESFPFKDHMDFLNNDMSELEEKLFEITHKLFQKFDPNIIISFQEINCGYEASTLFEQTYKLYTTFDIDLIVRFFDCNMSQKAALLMENTVQFLDTTNVAEIISITEHFRNKPSQFDDYDEVSVNLLKSFLQSLLNTCYTQGKMDLFADNGPYANYIRSIMDGKTLRNVLVEWKIIQP